MLVLAIPFLIYFFVLISLFAFFVLHILRNTKKVGFLNAIKSKVAITILVWIVICGVLPALLFAWSLIPRSGNQLFEDFILKPVPKSVEVLDSYDGSPNFDPDFCLHFKISPADFQLILASKSWKTVSDAPLGGLQCELGKKSWDFIFPPPLLGSNVKTYTFIPQERDVEIMFINTQMNEVYYFYHDGNLP